MKRIHFDRRSVLCTAVISLCFFLSSEFYIGWVYHLMTYTVGVPADTISMTAAYLLQATGIWMFYHIWKTTSFRISKRLYTSMYVILVLAYIPSLLGTTLAGVIAAGFVMNLMIGGIAGFYLLLLALNGEPGMRGKIFGFGYGTATFLNWGYSRISQGFHPYVKVLIDCLLCAGIILLLHTEKTLKYPEQDEIRTILHLPGKDTLLLVTGMTVFCFSVVKNLGFDFSTSDLMNGVSIEVSRLFYGIGLMIAGMLSDYSRKYSAVFTASALITPFIMLSLKGEKLPLTIFWCLDYLFYGFFAVFRIVVFSDFADERNHPGALLFGLLIGRIGDAAGTGIHSLISRSQVWMLIITIGFFFITIYFLSRLYRMKYDPSAAPQQSEKERFEQFSIRHDFSVREKEVLKLILEERTNSEIAETLFITENTVKFHVRNIIKKAGCRNRRELIVQYYSQLYELPERKFPF